MNSPYMVEVLPQWKNIGKKCHTAFQAIKIVERTLNKYNQSELDKEGRTKGEIASVKSRINKAKITIQDRMTSTEHVVMVLRKQMHYN